MKQQNFINENTGRATHYPHNTSCTAHVQTHFCICSKDNRLNNNIINLLSVMSYSIKHITNSTHAICIASVELHHTIEHCRASR